jgi:hypothetical protein
MEVFTLRKRTCGCMDMDEPVFDTSQKISVSRRFAKVLLLKLRTLYASACSWSICALSSSSSCIPVCPLRNLHSSSFKSYNCSSNLRTGGTSCWEVSVSSDIMMGEELQVFKRAFKSNPLNLCAAAHHQVYVIITRAGATNGFGFYRSSF